MSSEPGMCSFDLLPLRSLDKRAKFATMSAWHCLRKTLIGALISTHHILQLGAGTGCSMTAEIDALTTQETRYWIVALFTWFGIACKWNCVVSTWTCISIRTRLPLPL